VNSAISPANQWQFIVDGKRRAVGVRPRIRVNCDRPIRALALAGYGIGLCLLPTVRGDVAAGRLVRLLEAYEAYDRVVYAIYPHSRRLGARLGNRRRDGAGDGERGAVVGGMAGWARFG
jgi:DNA-binding transcriptional LysR family regulator